LEEQVEMIVPIAAGVHRLPEEKKKKAFIRASHFGSRATFDTWAQQDLDLVWRT
jgi:hypothetical protein